MMPPGLAPGHANPGQVNLITRLMHGGPPPGGAQGGKPNGSGMSPLDQIQSLIQDCHDAMRNISDPNIVNVIAGCLKQLTGVQQQLMTKGGPGGAA